MIDYQTIDDILPDIIGLGEDVTVLAPNDKRFIVHSNGDYEEIKIQNESLWDNIGPVAYLAGAILVSPISHFWIEQYAKRRKHLNKDNPEESVPKEVIDIARTLGKKYKVLIVIVKTDEKYYSDELISRGARERAYFISQESPQETARITEYLLKYNRFKNQSLREIANNKRIEQTTHKSFELNDKILDIIQEFKRMHNNIEPSLNRIAEILNEKNIETPSGGATKWFAQTVKRVIEKTQDSGHSK